MPATLSDALGGILSGLVRDLERGPGPEKWCKRCSRKHPKRGGCGLIMVTVWTRPPS